MPRPTTPVGKTEDHFKFKNILVYIASCRSARDIKTLSQSKMNSPK